ncbi:hypothetical protein [Pasteuria penetrans]|uniref:hypothetical protein n=1 Tax=Pasteuria penetrans TaxID=86005 RepID=UPI000F9BF3E7|nr:hypothetical protein [Pasteuria penetrans]
MLNHVIIRMTPLAFVLTLLFTFPVDIKIEAEFDDGGSPGAVTSSSADGDVTKPLVWFHRVPISEGCVERLLASIMCGAIVGAMIFGLRRGILWGVSLGAVVGIVMGCFILDILWPEDLFPIPDGYKGLSTVIMVTTLLADARPMDRSRRGTLLRVALAIFQGVVWSIVACLIFHIIL